MSETKKTDAELGEALKRAGKQAETERSEKRSRASKGSHLAEAIRAMAAAEGLAVTENKSYVRITGAAKGKAVCVAARGNAASVLGFDLQHPSVQAVSAEEATRRHLGKCRGYIRYDRGDELALEGFKAAVAELKAAE